MVLPSVEAPLVIKKLVHAIEVVIPAATTTIKLKISFLLIFVSFLLSILQKYKSQVNKKDTLFIL